MSEEVKSFLVFDEYSVTKMDFRRNYNFDDNKVVDLNFNFEGSANISNTKDEAWIELTCKIFEKEFTKGDAPFYLEIGLLGNFQLNVKEEDLDIRSFQLNALAILLPHLRAIIISFTAQAGIPPVILPPINVYKAFEMVESKQKDA